MSGPVQIQLRQLPHAADLPLPSYQTDGAAGMDIYAALGEPVVLAPLQRQLIPTGLEIALPPGYEAQIRPRSGLAFKQGLTLLNSPGTIDSDYRGEIGVILVNLSDEPAEILHGQRIAQMIIAPFVQAVWQPVAQLDQTRRGAGGFGSTGKGGEDADRC
jgi:dUTP pyrophosphatase